MAHSQPHWRWPGVSMEALGAAKPASQEELTPVQLDGRLDRAARCIARQLRVLSRIDRHPAEVKSAEAVFKTMLKTLEVMGETHELLTKHKGWPESRPSSSVQK